MGEHQKGHEEYSGMARAAGAANPLQRDGSTDRGVGSQEGRPEVLNQSVRCERVVSDPVADRHCNRRTSVMPDELDRLLSPKQVAAATSLHKTTLYRMEQRGLFPKAVCIGEKRIAYRESDVKAWIDALPQKAGT